MSSVIERKWICGKTLSKFNIIFELISFVIHLFIIRIIHNSVFISFIF